MSASLASGGAPSDVNERAARPVPGTVPDAWRSAAARPVAAARVSGQRGRGHGSWPAGRTAWPEGRRDERRRIGPGGPGTRLGPGCSRARCCSRASLSRSRVAARAPLYGAVRSPGGGLGASVPVVLSASEGLSSGGGAGGLDPAGLLDPRVLSSSCVCLNRKRSVRGHVGLEPLELDGPFYSCSNPTAHVKMKGAGHRRRSGKSKIRRALRFGRREARVNMLSCPGHVPYPGHFVTLLCKTGGQGC